MNREDLGKLLDLLGTLSSLARENKFKSAAYHKAAEALRETEESLLNEVKTLPKELAEERLSSVPGIGVKISSKVKEMLDTGTCSKLEELKTSHGYLLPLVAIHGIGPATALKLNGLYGVKDLDGVKDLIARGVIKDKRIIDGVSKNTERISYADAEKLVNELVAGLSVDPSLKVVPCGSFRRKSETVGDIDITVCHVSEDPPVELAKSLLDSVGEAGQEKVSGSKNGVSVDFRFTKNDSLGSMILYFTGPRLFNIKCRNEAIRRGWTLSEYGIFDSSKNRLAGKTEEEVLEKLGFPCQEPQDRK
jgi:DNA polymerase (family 10)